MQTIQTAWDFFQNEVLGMKWLNRLIGNIVEACGLDPASRIGGSVQFFFCIDYDDFLHSELFSARTNQKDTWSVSWYRCKHHCGTARNSNAVLLLLIHSPVHWLYRCRLTVGGYVFVSNFLSDGRPRQFGIAYEHIRVENCSFVCSIRFGHCCCRRYSD